MPKPRFGQEAKSDSMYSRNKRQSFVMTMFKSRESIHSCYYITDTRNWKNYRSKQYKNK